MALKPKKKAPRRSSKKKTATPRDRRAAMAETASRFSRWKPPGEVLINVRSVPTCFPWLDYRTELGGWPIGRVGIVHGPTGAGKSQFILGLGASFLAKEHFFAFLDAERTTTEPWVKDLMKTFANHPGFVALRPASYEVAVDAVREFATTIANDRVKGRIDPETTGLVVLDSLNKLVPKGLMAKMIKEGAEKVGVDGMKGGAGRLIAALNSQWFKELTILLDEAQVGFVTIIRERVNMNAVGTYSRKWSLTGGTDALYEASIQVRVGRDWVKLGDEVVGQKHDLKIYKSKIHWMDQPAEAVFYTSTGGMSPIGFDRARDVVTLAQEMKVLKVCKEKGKFVGWATEDGELVEGKTENELVATLNARQGLGDELEALCRAKFESTTTD